MCVVSVVCAIDLNCYNLILVSVTSFLCGCECVRFLFCLMFHVLVRSSHLALISDNDGFLFLD